MMSNRENIGRDNRNAPQPYTPTVEVNHRGLYGLRTISDYPHTQRKDTPTFTPPFRWGK